MNENEARPADVNLARIASALERLATVAERTVRVGPSVSDVTPPLPATTVTPVPAPYNGAPPPAEPRREFQFSASAGARLREGDHHDPDHKGVKPGRNGGLYCPTKLGDGTWCQWRQAA